MKMLGDLGWMESYSRGHMGMDGLGFKCLAGWESPLSVLYTQW